MRFEADDDTVAAGEALLAEVGAVLGILAERDGYRSGSVVRALDDPRQWCLLTEWESVGAYRRALGSYEVKAGATPLLSRARPEPSAYEALAHAPRGGPVETRPGDRSIPSRA
jgi:hypothetical protein